MKSRVLEPSPVWISLLILGSLSGCSSDQRAERPVLVPDSSVNAPAVPASSDCTSTGASNQAPRMDWKLSLYGIGPIRAGMTLAEVQPFLPGLKSSENLSNAECTYARSPSLPSGVVLMFEHGLATRIDVHTGSVRTAEGAGIGDTEAGLSSLYGTRLKMSAHKYTDGNYATVTPAIAADSNYRIVFETDGAKVLRFRSGVLPSVEYVEGCG